MNYIDFMKTGGIHIKKENRGKFTASAKRAGKSVQEHATDVLNDPNATRLQKRRAQFVKNAKKWKHEEGGILHAQTGAKVNLSYQTLTKKTEDPEEIKLYNTEEETEKTSTSETSQPEETNWWDAKAQHYLRMSGGVQQTVT
jgi:hypothetical protein